MILQVRGAPFEGAYVLMAAGVLLLLLLLLALVYLIARQHQEKLVRLLKHDLIERTDAWLSEHAPKLWRFIQKRFTLVHWHGFELTVGAALFFLTVYLFMAIAESWIESELLFRIDQQVYGVLEGTIPGDVIALMQTITFFGDFITVMVLGLCLAPFLYRGGHLWQAVSLLLSTAIGSAVLVGLKLIFERARPTEQIVYAAGLSFPSGHAFTSTVFYGYVIVLAWRLLRLDAVRIVVTIVLSLLIFLIGLSRIYLRVHWVSDVIGGFTIGLAWLIGSLVVSRGLQAYYK